MLELLTNARVYSPEDRGPGHILVGGGRILWTGTGEPEIPASFPVTVRDLGGRRVVPGLIDCHAHITGGGGEGGFASRIAPLTAREFLRGGTTTVIGLLGTDTVTRDMASLVATARGLCQAGMTAYCLTGGYQVPPATLTDSVRGDVVHIDRILGAGEIAISDHRGSCPTRDELLRIASEAYVGGMLAGKAGITHLHAGAGKGGLTPVHDALDASDLPARVFHPTHVNRDDALFAAALELADRGCPVDVSAFPVQPGGRGISAAEAVRRFLASDLPEDRITVSSDGGGSLPRFDEKGTLLGMGVAAPSTLGAALSELIASGMPPDRALPPFTTSVAAVLGLPAKGHLEPGADADLLVLDEEGVVAKVMALGRWQSME